MRGVPATSPVSAPGGRPCGGVLWAPRTQCGLQARLWGGLLARRGLAVGRAAQDGDGPLEAPGEQPSSSSAAGPALAEAVATDAGRVLDVELHTEVERSYLSYAMSVIVGRALPDVRDGLKPVHRRILFAMYDLGLLPSKPFRKSARVVGEVLGKYHPHGDSAVYDALVRLAQPFSMRLPLVDGHGNFGSQDADPAAAMRYTECRLQKAATSALLADLEQDTVDFAETFDGSEREPTVLPARLPTLLINGSQGIAVGTATNIPPHNAREVVAALEALIADPDVTVKQLMAHVPGPDFPTGGEVLASASLEEAYSSGRGPVTVRGRALIEQEAAGGGGEGRKGGKRGAGGGGGRSLIVITELPFQTNKAALVEHIAQLANDDKLQGVSDVRDESDREGMRVVVELKRGAVPEVVRNSLFQQTQLQKRFACNLVALVGGVPCHLGLKDLLAHFLAFRCEVVARRARFEQAKAERRLHIVEGLVKAQAQLDAVVGTIRRAADSAAAAAGLRELLGLSPEQTEAVLGLALRRLTSMEAGRLRAEQGELQARLASLAQLLGSQAAIRQTVLDEARELAGALGDERRTLVRRDVDGVLQQEDVIPNRQSVIVFSSRGYIKRMAADFFSQQGRGGKGSKVASLKADDSLEELQVVRDHQSLLFFTTDGQLFSIKAYEVPQASRSAIGTALPQVLKMGKEQRVAAMLPVTDFAEEAFVLLLSRGGTVKRMPLQAFQRMRTGSSAIELVEGDELVWVRLCCADDNVILATSDGRVQRMPVGLFRPMGRAARGMRGVRLSDGVRIVGMSVLPAQDAGSAAEEDDSSSSDEEAAEQEADPGDGPCILMVTEKGVGKRVPARLFRPLLTRGGKGVRGIRVADDDRLAAFHVITSEREALLSTANGLLTRISLDTAPVQGRMTKGVILMRPSGEAGKISTVSLIDADPEAEE